MNTDFGSSSNATLSRPLERAYMQAEPLAANSPNPDAAQVSPEPTFTPDPQPAIEPPVSRPFSEPPLQDPESSRWQRWLIGLFVLMLILSFGLYFLEQGHSNQQNSNLTSSINKLKSEKQSSTFKQLTVSRLSGDQLTANSLSLATLKVSGQSTLNKLQAATFNVSGPSTLSGALTASGGITTSSLNDSGSASFGSITAANVSVSGELLVNGVRLPTSGGTTTVIQSGSGSSGSSVNLSGYAQLGASQTFSGSNTFSSAVTIQGGTLTLGLANSSTGNLNLANSGSGYITSLQPDNQSNNLVVNIPVDPNTNDTVCLMTLNNCGGGGGGGSASGDLSGFYPDPTVAKLQGKTLTISASPTTGAVLQYSGSAFVDGLITNTSLSSGAFSSITGTGALASGSITSGFGTISTGNSISTTTTVQGGVVNATGTLELDGASINATGTLSNVAYLGQGTVSSPQLFTGNNTFSGSGNNTTAYGALFENSSNSTTAFAVQNSTGGTVLDADTTNGRVGIGTNTPANLLSIGALSTAYSGAQIAVSTNGTTNSGIVIQTVASQSSGYFLQAQSSNGTTLASIDYQGNLSVQNAVVNGTLSINGHIITGNPSGDVTTAAPGSDAGSGATASVNGNDSAGTVTFTTGTGSQAGTVVVISFSSPYSATPRAVFSPDNSNSAALQYFGSTSTTQLTLNLRVAPADNQTYTFDYIVEQ